MLSISDTATEMVNWVFPEHAGAPGQIHGGRMMQWIAACGTIAAARVARGNVVLGAMDDIDFLHPVKVGEIAVLRAQVEYVGRCSLEVGVRVYAETPATGKQALTLSSHLVFVKVDEHGKPLGEDLTLALASAAVLSRTPGPVVTNLSTSQVVEDVARAVGLAPRDLVLDHGTPCVASCGTPFLIAEIASLDALGRARARDLTELPEAAGEGIFLFTRDGAAEPGGAAD